MSIALLQREFQEYLLAGSAAIEDSIVDGPRLDARGRLAIYANAYTSRLIEILHSDYPGVVHLAGTDSFAVIAREYVAAYPSQTPNARWFGRHLSLFLRRDATDPSSDVLAEMADFEWALGTAFDAADDAVLELAHLAGLPATVWPGLRFSLEASVQRLDLQWNVPACWTALKQDEAVPALPPAASASTPQPWIVWRRDLTTWFRSLEGDEVWMFDAVAAGATFAEACDTLSEHCESGDVATRATGLLARWIGEGLLRAFATE